MHQPFIGISTYSSERPDQQVVTAVGAAYIQAVLRAGGLPVMIPVQTPSRQAAALLENLDGVLLTGGADIDPARFNGKPHPRVYDVDLQRDDLEISLVEAAVSRNRPVLAICRGIQVLNVALGGTLYTDIADQLSGAIKHDYYPGYRRDHPAHTVRVEAGVSLAGILGSGEITVNSLHHQGIERLAGGLAPAACAPDGLIEAVEMPGQRFCVGVQWHPEALPESTAMQRLFSAFIQAANHE